MGNTVTPIAVIGMACRLPGGIESPEALWEALVRGEDLVTEVPRERWDPDEYYDPEPGVPGRSVSKWGAFLADVDGFDPEFFGINESEARAIDPQHRLLLETSWEAMEHAGLTKAAMNGSLTGVFVGLTHGDYQLVAADAHAVEGPYGFSGNSFSMASGRIAYALGLHGPALTMDTACSSGLTAVHTACRSLHEGESNLAFAGGVSVMLDPRKFVSGSALGMGSPTGRCHAFDAAADGFVGGEGCVVLLLKRLQDAQRDEDRVLAVIRGTAANQDGHTVNIATPSRPAQVAAYRSALAVSGVDAATIGVVETHGTGTPTGDPIEFASLAEVYGLDNPCALAAVKTNFGHTQSASGALGVMKAVLALQHGIVPQNLHFTRLPDDLADIDTKLFVPQTNTPWPTNGQVPRRAAVSSYGMSGTNVHAILEQAPVSMDGAAPCGGDLDATPPMLFPLSSTSADELRRTAGRLAEWVRTHEDAALPDLAYTLTRRRAHRPVRTTVVASTRAELAAALQTLADSDTPYEAAVGQDDRGPVWVFSGQGSQWAQMGKDLLANDPVFAATVEQLEPLIARESGFSVTEAMTAPHMVTSIDQVQPTLFTMQVAMAAALKDHGARPGAVIGHSMGEAAAAVVAGALSLEDGARVICRRSRLMSTIAGSGAMASVELPAKQVLSELRGAEDVVVAVVASPESTVIGGDTDTVRALIAAWEERGVSAREVAVDVASHSPQVDPILDELADVLAEITPAPPEVPFYSATEFDPRDEVVCDSQYWVHNLRRTVRFATAVRAALEDGYRVFGELSPHPLLTNALGQTANSLELPSAALAGMRRDQALPYGLLEFVGDLHSVGAAVDFPARCPQGRLVDAPLPTWTHRRLWLDGDGQEAHNPGGYTVSAHPLMGPHVRLQEEPERHVWQAEIGTAAHPWLAEHRIRDVAVLPGAAYCEMALEAAQAVLGDAAEICDLRFERALLLDDHTAIGASVSLSSPGVGEFSVETNQGGETIRHAAAVLSATDDVEPPTYDLSALVAEHPHSIDGADVRLGLDRVGIHYGLAFTGLGAVRTADAATGTVLAEVALPRQIRSQQSAYGVHPALLDACFQSVGASRRVQELGENMMGLPLGADRLRSFGSARNARYCYTRVTKADGTGVDADLDVLDEHGAVLLTVRGLRCGTGASDAERRDRLLAERLLTVGWQERALPEIPRTDAGTWLLISTSSADVLPSTLSDAMKNYGARCTTMTWLPRGDHMQNTRLLAEHLRTGDFTGMVILTGPRTEDTVDTSPRVGCEYVKHLVRITRELPEIPGQLPHLFIVSRNAQTVVAGDVANLDQGGLRGLARVIGTEHPDLHTQQIDADDSTEAERLAHQLLSGSDEDETAWRNGVWYTARLRPAPLRPEERRTSLAHPDRDGMRLQVRSPGDLETLELVASERISPDQGQIEVAIAASSINFRDVLLAYDRYRSINGVVQQLGMDFAGVVTAIGPGVTRHQVGDRVGGMSLNGTWATFITCDERHAVTLPAGLTDAQAAALTTAHATAWYGLHELARISRGDKVLIHSGTGGVGQAAIAIARAAGAQIYATAGSEQRRQVLRDMGIEHVYDSRSPEFADGIRRDTDGYGVDIVLNSVSGPLQRAGIELLAFDGRFVEIGKRDIYGDTRLGLLPFQRNLSFLAFDLSLKASRHPDKFQDVANAVYTNAVSGVLPMPEATHYPLSDAAVAIRVMGAAQHTGKLLLDIPRAGTCRVVVQPQDVPVFREDGAYVLTGGLGGLGLYLAEKLAAARCGRIVLSSRSHPTSKAQEAIERIRGTGVDVVVECGDIADPGTAERLVAAATATGLPVRGVLHAAAVVEDGTLTSITDDLVERDWAPKVYGAWNLHTATADQPLDWFCAFSSAAALLGSPGQGAYAAANSWMDAFGHWRRTQGRPTTVIAWGAWGEVGRATDFAEGAGAAIASDEGAYAFETLLRHDRTYTGYAPIIGTPWVTAFASRSPFAEAFRASAQSDTGTGQLRAELNDLPLDEWPVRLRRLVSERISLILRRSIDPDRPLSEYGLDSLGALELRTRVEAETGVRLSPGDIAVANVRDLAELLYERMASADTRQRHDQLLDAAAAARSKLLAHVNKQADGHTNP
nr:type I polyketide synthase [Mycolicibacterium iranicum]